MSRFSEIDLSAYALPDILEVLDVESYLSRNKTLFTSNWDEIRGSKPPIDTLELEHEPITAQLRVVAEIERILRSCINDKIKQTTLAGARGKQLEHIAMTYFGGLTRRLISAATLTNAAIYEDDETFRQRIALSPESWSTCGPEGAYLFWALSASGDVLDVAAYSEDEGVCLAPKIRIVVLSRAGDGVANAALLNIVKNQLNRRELRPMGDMVSVESAIPLPYDVHVILRLRQGASAEIVKAAAERRIRAYCEGLMRWVGDQLIGPVQLVGRRILQDTIAGRAYGDDPNIIEVEVVEPSFNVNAPHQDYYSSLVDVGSTNFAPLEASLTQHLFMAPRLNNLTITTETIIGGGIS